MTRLFLDLACPFPRARIPTPFVWDLIEYLALHRTRVTYTYGPDHILVDFLHMTTPAAQRLLDAWSTTRLSSPITPTAAPLEV